MGKSTKYKEKLRAFHPALLNFGYFVLLASDCFKERGLLVEVHCVSWDPHSPEGATLLNLTFSCTFSKQCLHLYGSMKVVIFQACFK